MKWYLDMIRHVTFLIVVATNTLQAGFGLAEAPAPQIIIRVPVDVRGAHHTISTGEVHCLLKNVRGLVGAQGSASFPLVKGDTYSYSGTVVVRNWSWSDRRTKLRSYECRLRLRTIDRKPVMGSNHQTLNGGIYRAQPGTVWLVRGSFQRR